MTSFMLENAYLNYMMQVVNDTTKTLTSDAVITNEGCNIRDLYGTETTVNNAGAIARDIERSMPGYKTAVRVTSQGTYGLGSSKEAVDGCTLQGIGPEQDREVVDLEEKIVAGRFFEDDDPIVRGHTPLYIEVEGIGDMPGFTYGSAQKPWAKEEPYPVIVGKAAAEMHPATIKLGKKLDLFLSASARGPSFAGVSVKIIGLYESGTPTLDSMIWFMHADSLREIKGYGEITGKEWHVPGVGTFRGFKPIDINQDIGDAILVNAPEPLHTLNPIGYSETVRKEIAPLVPEMQVFTWHDLLVYAAGSMQDVITIMLWGSIAVTLFLAGAAIKYVMDSIVIRKTREIGSLKAFGARDRDIFKIFLYQGLVIGLASGLVGVFLSVLVMQAVNWYGLSMQFIGGTQLDIAFVVNWLTLAIALVVPIVLAIVAASIPAKKASILPPVEALRKGELSL